MSSILNLLEDNEYQTSVIKQEKELIELLVKKGQEFAITAHIVSIDFSPDLPDDIYNSLTHFPLFVLANYTFESLKIHSNYITFEAGFGSANFGSVVTIPLTSIFQIIVDETMIFINPLATLDDIDFSLDQEEQEEETDQKTRSMNAFKQK
jgi:hypothetical protein